MAKVRHQNGRQKKKNKMMRPISFILQKFLNKQGDEFYMCVK